LWHSGVYCPRGKKCPCVNKMFPDRQLLFPGRTIGRRSPPGAENRYRHPANRSRIVPLGEPCGLIWYAKAGPLRSRAALQAESVDSSSARRAQITQARGRQQCRSLGVRRALLPGSQSTRCAEHAPDGDHCPLAPRWFPGVLTPELILEMGVAKSLWGAPGGMRNCPRSASMSARPRS